MKKILTYAFALATLMIYSCSSESESTSTETGSATTDSTEATTDDAQSGDMKEQLKDVMGENAGEESVLDKDDIERFKTSVGPMSKAFEELGKDMEGGTPETMDAFLSNEKIVAVLEDNGWDKESFGPKFTAITLGVAYITIQKQMEQVPEEQRGQMQQMLAGQLEQYKSILHDDDLALIEEDFAALQEAMENAQ